MTGHPNGNSSGGSRNNDLASEGAQFDGDRKDLPQSLELDEGDDLSGPEIAYGETFIKNLKKPLSFLLEPEDATWSKGSVEGVGGVSTAPSGTYVEVQNGESSRDGALRNQRRLAPPEVPAESPQAFKSLDGDSFKPPKPDSVACGLSTRTAMPPSRTKTPLKALFRKHNIIIFVLLIVIIPMAVGVIVGIKGKNLGAGLGSAAAVFLSIAVVFTLLRVSWKREERLAKVKKENAKRAATAEEARKSLDPKDMV
ncbi:hypothetical protein FGG08_004398 [Glutinoglossum americanum]|uniref:Uncharacterized protein n=1 Tax=Glutinoglossum americanum TaxID=1670608 RepID=A0A9P8I5E8_9PEZI|nr:hypothetical protein FGG08_004398 [Glutinoglossum americanum]